jgi:hypothetical protein
VSSLNPGGPHTAADLQEFVDVLKKKHKFKLKGTGTLAFHIVCDFFRDDEGILCMVPKKYIEKTTMGCKQMFGEKSLAKVHSPLEKGDHPELDTSKLLDQTDGVQQYQLLIGSLQWAISLGCLDIATAVISLSSFWTLPCRGQANLQQPLLDEACHHSFLHPRTGLL